MQWLEATSSSAREICLSKYSAPALTYITRVIWVQAGRDRAGQAGSQHVSMERHFQTAEGQCSSPTWLIVLVLPTTHTKRTEDIRAATSVELSGFNVWRWLGAAYCVYSTPLDNRSHFINVNLTVQQTRKQQWLIFTIVWDSACICKWEQHVQHGYSIRQLVKAVNMLMDSVKQLTYHPVGRCKRKAL